jgi:hypothetical protein
MSSRCRVQKTFERIAQIGDRICIKDGPDRWFIASIPNSSVFYETIATFADLAPSKGGFSMRHCIIGRSLPFPQLIAA